jgi:polyhydroxyalkanoate synthesis regulator phasin
MAENDLLKRLLDAGMTFTAMTQARAEDLIRDLVRAGEVQAEQAQSVIDELVDRSRRNSERLIDAVRSEIRQQVAGLGLATKDDVERLERRIADVSAAAAPAARGARKATGPKRAPARKAAGKAARKATKAKKAPARQATKAPRKKAPARQATKATGKKATGRKAGAKKATRGTRSSTAGAARSSR